MYEKQNLNSCLVFYNILYIRIAATVEKYLVTVLSAATMRYRIDRTHNVLQCVLQYSVKQ